jgi:myosin-5
MEICNILFSYLQMQGSLDSERQRADDSERKYNKAQESSEDRRKKLEETEKKVHQLQESLAR